MILNKITSDDIEVEYEIIPIIDEPTPRKQTVAEGLNDVNARLATNKIEHRLFCYISSHGKGQPLISIEAIIDLIGSTTTTSGLKVLCVKDENTYEIGIKVTEDDFEKITIKKETTCPDWNYIISPNK